MNLPITTLATCILALLLVVLSLRIIIVRRGEKVSLGSGDNNTLERRIRAQGNLVEYATMGLFLIGLAEFQQANAFLVGIASAAFVMGRLLHGYALGFTDKALQPRVTGMVLTLCGLIALIGINFWLVIIG